jgi:catechol 2,3-dioxygenase-like lactoylglutathione lyase family enzyme
MRVHVSIPVKDLDKSIRFYRRLFASEPSKVKSDYANFRLDEPPIHLSMIEHRDAPAGPLGQHFGIELPDLGTLQNWRVRTEEKNFGVFEEPQAKCCYAQGEKLWLTDPDGYRWEVWVRTGEFNALDDPAGSVTERAGTVTVPITACCT